MSRLVAMKAGTTQTAAYTATSAAITNAVGTSTTTVRIVCTTAAYITFGVTPVATSAHVYMPAGIPEYFDIAPGHKVAAIQVASGGNMHVTEMTS
jgi:hypothetical protein